MRPLITMRAALADEQLFAGEFGGASWLGWRALLCAMLGEKLNDEERAIFRALTGREREPLQKVQEFWGAIGRRGGKSRAIALLVTYLATLVDHRANLSLGERGVVLVMAQNTRQARVIFSYVVGLLEGVPALRGQMANKTSEVITLVSGLDIEIRAASFRGLRGVTCVCAVADEISYWFDETSSTNPDHQILDSIRPSLSTTCGMLVAIGSPHARRGTLWTTYQRHHGAQGDPLILVAQGASRDLNPTLPQSVVDRALEQDEAVAKAEYLGLFRSDLEAYISREQLEPCIAVGVRERGPLSDTDYVAFVDPAGGSGSDSMTLAIAHKQDDVIIVDLIRSRSPPFSPDATVHEFCETLALYRVSKVTGDRFGGEFVREPFRDKGVAFELAEKPKSALYVDLVPLINSRRIELLDDKRLVNQLLGLERRVARGTGRDLIDHAANVNAHDDVANVCAGVASLLAAESHYWRDSMAWIGQPASADQQPQVGPPIDPPGVSLQQLIGGWQWH
jgi:hypothetical protein